MTFQPSDKVVCIAPFVDEMPDRPQLGCVYVVRGVRHNEDGDGAGGLLLVGMSAGLWWDGTECAYYACKFRLLSECQGAGALKNKASK